MQLKMLLWGRGVMAAASDSKSDNREIVWVRVPPPPPNNEHRFDTIVSNLFSLHKGFISLSVN